MLHVVPIVPCKIMLLGDCFPIIPFICAQTDKAQTFFVFLRYFLHFGDSLKTNRTRIIPEVKQNKFSFQFSQAVLVTLQVKKLRINHRFPTFYLFVGIKYGEKALSLNTLFMFVRQTLIERLYSFLVGKIIHPTILGQGEDLTPPSNIDFSRLKVFYALLPSIQLCIPIAHPHFFKLLFYGCLLGLCGLYFFSL